MRTTNFVRLTNHAKRKSLQRFALPEGKLLELAEKSVMYGYSINDAPNIKVKKYLQKKASKGKLVYAYYGYLFIFDKEFALITTYSMPKHYLYGQ